MSNPRPVEFANFICRAGALELLDFAEFVIIPAFQQNFERQWGENRYFLHAVQLVDFAPNTPIGLPALCGRFVKDTVLRSEQVFASGQLRANNQRIRSAPSAFFVLLLETHKLIYCREYRGAPGLDTFRATIQQFIKRAHIDHIQTLYEEKKAEAERQPVGQRQQVTKNALLAKFPSPTLEIVPLASKESIREFIARFEKLQSLSIRLVKPNNELNNEGFFRAMHSNTKRLGASTSSLAYKNAGGLNKAVAVVHAEAAADGNAKLNFAGKDDQGRKLTGSNKDFRLVTFIQGLPANTIRASRRLIDKFQHALRAGLVSGQPDIKDEQAESLATIRRTAISDDD